MTAPKFRRCRRTQGNQSCRRIGSQGQTPSAQYLAQDETHLRALIFKLKERDPNLACCGAARYRGERFRSRWRDEGVLADSEVAELTLFRGFDKDLAGQSVSYNSSAAVKPEHSLGQHVGALTPSDKSTPKAAGSEDWGDIGNSVLVAAQKSHGRMPVSIKPNPRRTDTSGVRSTSTHRHQASPSSLKGSALSPTINALSDLEYLGQVSIPRPFDPPSAPPRRNRLIHMPSYGESFTSCHSCTTDHCEARPSNRRNRIHRSMGTQPSRCQWLRGACVREKRTSSPVS